MDINDYLENYDVMKREISDDVKTLYDFMSLIKEIRDLVVNNPAFSHEKNKPFLELINSTIEFLTVGKQEFIAALTHKVSEKYTRRSLN